MDGWEDLIKTLQAMIGDRMPPLDHIKSQLNQCSERIIKYLDSIYNIEAVNTLSWGYEQMCNSITEDGSLDLEPDLLKDMLSLDKATEIGKVDALVGVSKFLSKASPLHANEWASKVEHLVNVEAGLPVFHAVCIAASCLQAYNAARGIDKSEALTTFLASFTTLTTEVNALQKSQKAQQICSKALCAKKRLSDTIVSWLRACVDSCLKMAESLREMTPPNWDRLIKDLDNNLGQLVELPRKAEILETLKDLNGAKGNGLKQFDSMVAACDGIITHVNDASFETIRKDIVNARQAARKIICIRAAASAIVNKRGDDVDSIYMQAKNLKVTLDAKIRGKLDEVKKNHSS